MNGIFFEGELREIALEKIRGSPYQPRREFFLDDLEELAASIQEVGLIHPPVVRECRDGTYELIAGERRLRAIKLLGWIKIQVLVRRQGDTLSAKGSLIENIQRKDLNPLEVASALKNWMESSQLTQEELADQVGKKRSTIANYLRLLQLPGEIQKKVLEGSLSMGHAKAILSLPPERQRGFALEILRDNLTVRGAENRAKKILEGKYKKEEKILNLFFSDLKTLLEERFGTRVTLQGGKEKGKVTFEYHTLDDLDRLLQSWGLSDRL